MKDSTWALTLWSSGAHVEFLQLFSRVKVYKIRTQREKKSLSVYTFGGGKGKGCDIARVLKPAIVPETCSIVSRYKTGKGLRFHPFSLITFTPFSSKILEEDYAPCIFRKARIYGMEMEVSLERHFLSTGLGSQCLMIEPLNMYPLRICLVETDETDGRRW